VQERKADLTRYYELKQARTAKGSEEATSNTPKDKLLETRSEEEEKLYVKLFTGRFKAPYNMYDRLPGCGPLRTGEHLDLNSDIYSLLFVSFINWELVKKCKAEVDDNENMEEKMLKKFAKQHREKEREMLEKRASLQEVKDAIKTQILKKATEEFNKELDKMVAEETEEEEETHDARQLRIRKLISGHSIQRADYLAQVLFVWITQMMLCVILVVEMVRKSVTDSNTLCMYPAGFWVVMSRFLCAIVLHMQLQGELT